MRPRFSGNVVFGRYKFEAVRERKEERWGAGVMCLVMHCSLGQLLGTSGDTAGHSAGAPAPPPAQRCCQTGHPETRERGLSDLLSLHWSLGCMLQPLEAGLSDQCGGL